MSCCFLGIQDVVGTHLALLLYGFSWFIGTTCGHGCGSGLNHGRGVGKADQGVPGRTWIGVPNVARVVSNNWGLWLLQGLISCSIPIWGNGLYNLTNILFQLELEPPTRQGLETFEIVAT